MSFTTTIKTEITQNELDMCCQKAQLAALIQMCSTLNMSSEGMFLVIKSENPTTAKRCWKLLKDVYNVETQLSVIKKMKLKKNNIYVIRVLNKAKDILMDLGILNDEGLQTHPKQSLFNKDCCIRAYLGGVFLAKGSCNSPTTSNYHLEIVANTKELANFIIKKMNKYDLPAKYILRRSQHVVYLKQSDKISDFLRCVGCSDALFAFEDQRIQRDFMNSFTRLDNCELANEMKILSSGKAQLEDIEKIENYSGINALPKKLQEVAVLRKELPEASLMDLCEEFHLRYGATISKSGMRHRLAKIKDIASSYN
ncbi:MAG: DNA-binding protein WhiA [Erysipelotrichaceae bacterium]